MAAFTKLIINNRLQTRIFFDFKKLSNVFNLKFFAVFFFANFLLIPNLYAQIITSENFFGHYRQFVWQDQHGLPQNGISKIVQTSDGYLWLAIAEGVVRFDGVRFTAFDTGNTPEIKSNNVQSLLVSRNGTLWIGTHGGGLTSYREGKFTNYSVEQGLSDSHIKCLFEDSNGDIWIGTDGGGLNLFRGGKFIAFTKANGLPNDQIGAIAEDRDRDLWIGTGGGLILLERKVVRKEDEEKNFQNAALKIFTTKDGLAGNSVRALFLDRDKNLWIGGASGLSRYRDGKFSVIDEREGFTPSEVWEITQDAEGVIWVGTIGEGVFRLKNSRFESASSENGLINDNIQAVFPDVDGNIWLGTSGGGLVELKEGKFSTFNKSDGLPGEMVNAVFVDSTGGIWIGTDEGLTRFKDEKFNEITSKNGQKFKGISGITQDSQGNIWIYGGNSETGSKILKFAENDSTVEVLRENVFDNRASAILHDRNGNIWFGTSYDGLKRVGKDDIETSFHKSDGLADEYVDVLFEDKDGGIWIGTRNGLSRFKDGKISTFSSGENFSGKHILSFHEDKRGNLWIGTHGDGLFRFRDGKFNVITSKNGLYDNLAFQILEDSGGNLWMSGNKGIYRANINELEEFTEGKRASINSFSYGSADGMLSRECNGASPAGAKAKDGKLWFPTIKGVVAVEPDTLSAKSPFVTLEKILIDDQIFPINADLEINPNQNNFEIEFSALSWNRPQQVNFKYKLDGLDADWIAAGTRRTAYYPHIPPGEYVFRVIADNGEGVWNTKGKTIKIRVLPPYYQTWWFFVLCALAVAFIIRLIYGYRLSQLEKINQTRAEFTQKLIDHQEQESQRIAVELHDSIGQSLIVIRNRALMSLNQPEKSEKVLAQMEEISEAAADSINEIRQIAHNLHPYQLEHLGLTTALETMIEQSAESSEINFDTDFDDVDNLLSKESEINLYRVVQESLNNILKHSQATEAKIRLIRNNGNLNLSIEDNGKGFDLGATKVKRGLGLTGISERARMLNAAFDIHSHEGQGTEINLKLKLP